MASGKLISWGDKSEEENKNPSSCPSRSQNDAMAEAHSKRDNDIQIDVKKQKKFRPIPSDFAQFRPISGWTPLNRF